MTSITWLFILIVISYIVLYISMKRQYNFLKNSCNKDTFTQNKLEQENRKLKADVKYLNDVKDIDDQIFSFIRCINIPQVPSCKAVNKEGVNVCRSKQIDCDKFKLVILNSPIGLERIKKATDKYYDSSKRENPSELTYPVKSGWLF